MSIIGWYYLHTNGDLIYKRDLDGTAADIRESNFARAMWPFDPDDRECAWDIVVEAEALGARSERIAELALKWQCDDQDADIYAERRGITLQMDGNQWCATGPKFSNLQESPAGFGDTKRQAMSALCKDLGYKGGKMWNATFKSLHAIKEKP
jgi:hypothetical protein